MKQNAPDKTDNILTEFITALKLSLNDKLIGIYLYGSLATDDFVEDKSDIDLLIILEGNVDQKILSSLTSLHEQFNSRHKPWQNRIDVAYVSQFALWNFLTTPYEVIVSYGKGLLRIVNAPQYYLIDWYKVQEHGIPLLGPAVNKVMPPISSNHFKQSVRDYMQTYTESVKCAEKRGEQAYVIVTMCRSLYAYKFAEHVSKQFGSQWAMDEYPQWRELIQKALDWSRNKKVEAIIDKDNKLETTKFVDFVLNKAK